MPLIHQCTLAKDSTLDITVERLGEYVLRNHDLVFPHKHNFYQFVLFTSSSGKHSIDFQHFAVAPWQCYSMTPAQIHTWEFDQNTDGYIINFDLQTLQAMMGHHDSFHQFSFFSGQVDQGVFTLSKRIRDSVRLVCEHMLYQSTNVDFCKVSLIYLFNLIQTERPASTPSNEVSHNARLLSNFLSLIESNYKTMRLPKEFAALLYITPNYLNALCNEKLGASAGELIRRRVLLEAKRLLATRNFTVSEIAYALNFNDNSYFSKFFKKIEGMTPEEFRHKIWNTK